MLLGANPPLMLKTASNPNGTPLKVFDEIRAGTRTNRSQYWKDLAVSFYGYNRKGAKVSQGVIDAFWLQSMQNGIKGEYDCIKQFSETDFTEDLKKIDVPTLIAHGDDDQSVPIAVAALLSSKRDRTAGRSVPGRSGPRPPVRRLAAGATLATPPGARCGVSATSLRAPPVHGRA